MRGRGPWNHIGPMKFSVCKADLKYSNPLSHEFCYVETRHMRLIRGIIFGPVRGRFEAEVVRKKTNFSLKPKRKHIKLYLNPSPLTGALLVVVSFPQQMQSDRSDAPQSISADRVSPSVSLSALLSSGAVTVAPVPRAAAWQP